MPVFPVEFYARDVAQGPGGEPAGPVRCPGYAVYAYGPGEQPVVDLFYLEMPYPGSSARAYVTYATSVPFGVGVNCWRYPPPPQP